MARLEELTHSASVKEILPNQTVMVVDVAWQGSDVVSLTHKDDPSRGRSLYRDREPMLEVVNAARVIVTETHEIPRSPHDKRGRLLAHKLGAFHGKR